MRARKINVMAAATLLGVTMAGMPVLAAPDTNVTYVSGATEVGNGELLMVVPADLYLTQENTTASSEMVVRMTDGTLDLPNDLQYDVSLSSENGLKLKTTEAGLQNREGTYAIKFGTKETATDLAGLATAKQEVKAFSIGDGANLETSLNGAGKDGTFVPAANGKGTAVSHDFEASITDDEAAKLEGRSDVEYKDVVTFKLDVTKGTGVMK